MSCKDGIMYHAKYYDFTFYPEFRECFYLYARSGQIQTMDELTVVMRSLNMSPTIAELRAYMKSKNGKMAFSDFLDIMHQHSTKVTRFSDQIGK